MTVLVALFGKAYGPFVGEAQGPTGVDLAFEKLPQTEVEVGADDTLGDVIDRAARAFGIALEDNYPRSAARVSEVVGGVAFDHHDHPPLWHEVFPAVNPEGLVYWADIKDVRHSDLRRASTRGLLDGDPTRVYFQPFPRAGAADVGEWKIVLAALGTLWAVLKVMTESRAALDTLRAIRDRLGLGRKTAEANYIQWSKRGARPGRLGELLRARSWTSDELASLMACTREEAEAILWSFGFTTDDAGVWHFGGDSAAVLLADAIETSMSDVARLGTPEQLARLYRERIDTYLQTGEFPKPPWHDLKHWYWDE